MVYRCYIKYHQISSNIYGVHGIFWFNTVNLTLSRRPRALTRSASFESTNRTTTHEAPVQPPIKKYVVVKFHTSLFKKIYNHRYTDQKKHRSKIRNRLISWPLFIAVDIYIYMSGGQNYLKLAMDLAKVGGPVSVGSDANLNMPSPLPTSLVFR